MRLKYKDLLKIGKDEGLSVKGKKRQVAKVISKELPAEKVREYFAKISGVTPTLLMHVMVPDHEVMSKADVEKLLKDFRCDKTALPKIKDTDPAVLAIKAKPGDVIRIKRRSHTAGESFYYRLVVKHVT
jgi:DNA-directed RNA polymerase subunit H